MNSQSKNILITGATGFVGSYLARFLVKNGFKNIVCLKRNTSRMDLISEVAHQVIWEEGDVLDMPFLENILRGHHIEQVYHCAAVVSFDPRDREDMYRINVEGTENVVNAALEVGIEKLVYVSSIAAIGRVEHEPWVCETNKWQRSPLNSHYAISKFQAEQEVWRGIAEGLKAAIVNPTVILGSQFWEQGTGRLFKQVWEGLRFYTEGATGYVDVRDVVLFMAKLMDSDIDNQRFVLNGDNMTYKKMFEDIAHFFNKKSAHIAVTPPLREVAWRVEWLKSRFTGRRPLITKETARTSGVTFYFDNSKSKRMFPDFEYSDIARTIEETAQQFLETEKKGGLSAVLPV